MNHLLNNKELFNDIISLMEDTRLELCKITNVAIPNPLRSSTPLTPATSSGLKQLKLASMMIIESSLLGYTWMRKAMEGKQNLPSYYMMTRDQPSIDPFIIDNTNSSIITNDNLCNINLTTVEQPNVSSIEAKPTYVPLSFLEQTDTINLTDTFKNTTNK